MITLTITQNDAAAFEITITYNPSTISDEQMRRFYLALLSIPQMQNALDNTILATGIGPLTLRKVINESINGPHVYHLGLSPFTFPCYLANIDLHTCHKALVSIFDGALTKHGVIHSISSTHFDSQMRFRM